MALMSERSWNDWIAEYAKSHHHPSIGSVTPWASR